MLVKKELLTVPVLPAFKPKGKTSKECTAAAQIVDLPKSGRILAVDYYRKKDLISRFFCDKKNFTVFEPDTGMWGQKYPTPGSYGYYANVECSDQTNAIVNGFFPEMKQSWRLGISSVNEFIYGKYADKRDRHQQMLSDRMDQHFAMFPELPANLKSFCNEQVFKNNYIFFGKKTKKGIRNCRCSRCGHEFDTTAPLVSGERAKCHKCGSDAILRAAWIKADVEDKAKICICHKVDGFLLIRWTRANRTFIWPDFKESMRFEDCYYSLYLNFRNEPRIYSYRLCRLPYDNYEDWHLLSYNTTNSDSTYVYTENLNEVFGERYYNVNLKAGLDGNRVKVRFADLLTELKNDPKAEYLFKLGLPQLAQCAYAIRGNPDGQGVFQQQLGISKQYLPMLRDMGVNLYEFSAIQGSKDWVTPALLEKYRALKSDDFGAFDGLAQRLGFARTLNYLDKQRLIHPKAAVSRLAIEFRDYLSMSDDLHVDLSHKSVLFPADVREAHKTITGRFNQVKEEIKMQKAAKLDDSFHEKAVQLYSQYGLSEYTKGEYTVVLPQKRTDLIAEGQSLNHCVGGDRYYQNHMDGVFMIFFIRKAAEPAKPFVTMELDMRDGTIKQLYGFGDCTPQKEVRDFAHGFAKYTQRQKVRKTA